MAQPRSETTLAGLSHPAFGGSNSPFGPPIAMRCWTGVVRSLGMGGRSMSPNALVAARTGSHLARIKRGAMIKKTRDSSTGQISSLDHNQILQRNAGYLSPTNRPGMVNKCTPGGREAGRTTKSIIPTCICNPVQVGRPAYPKPLQPLSSCQSRPNNLVD